jgi:hypothetical protein
MLAAGALRASPAASVASLCSWGWCTTAPPWFTSWHRGQQKARPILAEGTAVPAWLIEVHVEQPAELQLVVQLFAKRALTAHRV